MNTKPQTRVRLPMLDCIDLACENVGGSVLEANDEFFAEKENLIKAESPIFIVDKYTDRGKWMDGWESRRKRVVGYDWCTLRLGIPGVIHGFNVDTSFFTGNFPEFCSIEACEQSNNSLQNANWVTLVEKSRLQGDSENFFPVSCEQRFTHLRFNIFPDGGVARLRVHGVAKPDWNEILKLDTLPDLAAIEHGGTVVACNDMWYGPKDNLILPGRAKNMGGGWETRRRRGPGFDWTVVKLGTKGIIEKIEVDTNHFKGNFPDSCSLEAAHIDDTVARDPDFLRMEHNWQTLLPRTHLKADTRHFFEKEVNAIPGPITHVRMNIYPDGGISRLRLFGRPQL